MASYSFKKKDLYKAKEVFKKYDSTAPIRDAGELEKEKLDKEREESQRKMQEKIDKYTKGAIAARERKEKERIEEINRIGMKAYLEKQGYSIGEKGGVYETRISSRTGRPYRHYI